MRLEAFLTGRVLTAMLMLAIFSTMSLMALGFPERAGLMPLLVGVPGSVLALVQVFLELRAAGEHALQQAEDPQASGRNELPMLAWMLAFFLGILGFGFLYAAPALVLGFLRLGNRDSWSVGIVGAVATWAVLFGLFETAFQIPLFDGLLVAWLLG